MGTRQGLSGDQPGDPVMEDHCLLSVGSHTLTECLLAWKPVVQGGDAALVGDNSAGHTLHSGGKIRFLVKMSCAVAVWGAGISWLVGVFWKYQD